MGFIYNYIRHLIVDRKFTNKQILFNVVCISGFVGGVISLIVSLTTSGLAVQNIFTGISIVVLIACFYLGNRKKHLTLASILLALTLSVVLFPVLFFTGGGHSSGVPFWFSLVLIFSFLIFDSPLVFIIAAIQVAAGMVCYGLEYYGVINPVQFETETSIFKDNIQSFLIVTVIVGVMNIIQNLIYKNSVELIEDRNKDLEESEQKAEKANSAKTDFLSNMSHEIRTPINSILGMNEMILRESKEKPILDYAAAIQTSGRMLLSLVNDILDFSKIESGRLEIINEQYKLSDLVLDSYGMVSERLEKKNLKGGIFCNENLPSVLNGDMIHIRQILVNFLTNAAKYTDHGNVDFFILGTSDGKEAKLIFSVKDTGIGIKEEDLDNMFKKFERFDLQRNRNIEGSGLGLSISKRLADLMGAKIEVKSEYGKGSEFILTVTQTVVDASPVGTVNPKRSIESEVQIYHQSFEAPDADILAVDDVKLNLIVFANLLKETKMKIDLAGSGQEGVELAKKKHYDLIFMDYMMPGMDGIEALKKLREEAIANYDTPVIVLTADAVAGSREKYVTAGFKDYVSKPIDGENLEKVVVKYLPPEKVYYKTGKDETPCSEQITRLKTLLLEFDYEAALSKCDHSEKFCTEIISQYCSNNRSQKLREDFEECEWESYRQNLAILRDFSETVGLKTLSDEFKLQEEAVKKCELDYARKNHRHLLEHYEKCISKMTSAGFFKEVQEDSVVNEEMFAKI